MINVLMKTGKQDKMTISLCLITWNEIQGCKHDIPLLDKKQFEEIYCIDGGSTDGKGTDLVIGSGTYIDNFEEQLVGAHPGDKVEVTVVFPDDYQAADLAGKEAVFDVTVNGIYE